ncbi:unnamed protein product [Parnassius apollo]|uniref:(apollo) hypothetical protein n=1 Tax=Parnassius apollo TaxID=110799 RepID=A0A8S3XX18_PARAO|nr:unnamed protein product [Parnassius apollo]
MALGCQRKPTQASLLWEHCFELHTFSSGSLRLQFGCVPVQKYFKIFAIRKKVKMTDKPKRPMSAYMLWLNSAREQIKADNPGLRVTEIAKKGGEIWRSMTDKSVWEEKAAKAKEQYTKDLESYNANGGGGEGGGKKAQKRGKKAKKAAAPAKSKKKKEESEEEEGEEEEEESD